MDYQRAIILLSQMYLPQFDEEEREALTMAISVLQNRIPKEVEHIHINHGKHQWKKDSNGEIDEWAWDYEHHSGAVCEICGYNSACTSCCDDWEEDAGDCEENFYICPVCNKKYSYKREICECGQMLKYTDK